jgi:CDGSH-type Zn-finger protein
MVDEKKPMIIFTKNSPYYAVDVPKMVNTRGKEYPLTPVTAICRCGRSKKMPYCDGSHVGHEFMNPKSESRTMNEYKEYQGRKITVIYNRAICNHNSACLNGLPGVFQMGTRPWVRPDNGSVDEIIDLIKHCPTGALSYEIDGVHYDSYDRPPQMVINPGGGIDVEGGIDLRDDEGVKPYSSEHYVLCRCGASRNKPFCDGSHYYTNFEY